LILPCFFWAKVSFSWFLRAMRFRIGSKLAQDDFAFEQPQT
jgi:hypothetical protein